MDPTILGYTFYTRVIALAIHTMTRNKNRRRARNRRQRRKNKIVANNNDRNVFGPNANRFSNVILTPDRMFIKMRFAYLFSASSTSAVEYPFVGNSIYDPDPAVGGASADGFSQWMAFYKYYRVHASTLRVDVTADYSGASPNYSTVRVVTCPSRNSTWTLSPNAMATSRFARKTHIAWSGGGYGRVSNTMTTCKITGLRSDEGDMFSLSGTDASNPSVLWYWHTLIQGMSQADFKVFVEILLTYHVELWFRKDTIELSETVQSVIKDGVIVSSEKTSSGGSAFSQSGFS